LVVNIPYSSFLNPRFADILIFKENIKFGLNRFGRAENPIYLQATSLAIRWIETSSFITNQDEFKTAIDNFE
jgi:hypothetical protein